MAKALIGPYEGKEVKINPCVFYEGESAFVWVRHKEYSELAYLLEQLELEPQEMMHILDNSKQVINDYIIDLEKRKFERRQTNE